ncbi:hypothetical protein [Marinobacter sp. P4B1]|uniref:hypothetical protein n=1 Tax=Marinobacter sp. P4B1 TaxID=1119533 RepID=UPI00071E4540|nr:hypothetical protein [Marinobacter sp. P4B1]KRW83709.1 ribonucleoside-diphosphate reductase [Marinobacter sp. P4B1]
MKEIEQKIVGFKVAAKNNVTPFPQADDDPTIKRIEERPEGSLEAVSEKIVYSTAEGKQKVYVLVSFMKVEGVLDGKPVTVERPIEFFFPIGQGTSEHQWISATMRSLSLAARGGYAAQNLQDLRKVAWDKGPVRCGVNAHGKPIYHNSEVAAIAWSLQQILYRRGFLDADFNQVPARYLAKMMSRSEESQPEIEHAEPEKSPKGAGMAVVGECPECSGDLILRDGCPTCSCGYSKC